MIKTERAQIHFFIEVFVFIASLDLNVRNIIATANLTQKY